MILRRSFITLLPIACIILDTSETTRTSIPSVAPATQSANNQAKRDISLSYSATDINSKEGTRLKTISVIKNLNKDGPTKKFSVNPDIIKNEDWANTFRDNFDSYGRIPDVPDIDDLFELMKKKPEGRTESKIEKSLTSAIFSKRKHLEGRTEEEEKPVSEATVESSGVSTVSAVVGTKTAKPSPKPSPKPSLTATSATIATNTKAINNKSRKDAQSDFQTSSTVVEKIKGDAELLPVSGDGQRRQSSSAGARTGTGDTRSQSLSFNKEGKLERVINLNNYSTPQGAMQQYVERYVQENKKGYDYIVPCANPTSSSVNAATSPGGSYNNLYTNRNSNANINPYIAPLVAKKPPSATNPPRSTQYPVRFYPYNLQQSNVRPLPVISQPAPDFVASVQAQPTTSQRPYVAPNIRNGLGFSNGPTLTPIYGSPTTESIYRLNIFGINNLKKGRSRGLKY